MAVSRDSIHKATLKAAQQIRASLKARGITVPDVDGGHDSDAGLRGLQELQAIGGALEQDDAVRTSSVGTTSTSPISAPASLSGGSTGDSGTGKK